jgi:uncharacterized SAM-binding protein YcdF (DUF218 family)
MKNFIDEQAKIVWDYMLMHHELKTMDAIFALGCNDTRVAERAAELFLQGYGKYIIFSGGNGKNSDFTKPEAEVFKNVAVALGVPTEKIIVEPNATNTGENVLFTKKLLEEKGYDFHSFILVQKPYMERRTFATFKKRWPEPECLVTSPKISYEEYASDEEFKKIFINIMVGDLIRIKEYPKLGYQIEQDMSENVWTAGKKLVEFGFDKYVL